MVQIIKQGDLALTKPWYCRVTWECTKCLCQWTTDESDTVKAHSDQREGDWAEMPCPTCGERTIVYPRQLMSRDHRAGVRY